MQPNKNKKRKPLKYSVEGCMLHGENAITTCDECLQNYNMARDKIRNKERWICTICNKSTSPKNKTNHIRSLHHKYYELKNKKD